MRFSVAKGEAEDINSPKFERENHVLETLEFDGSLMFS
jgi:hypothetical protein